MLNVCQLVRLRKENCIGQKDRTAVGTVVDIRDCGPRSKPESEYQIRWNDGFPSEWFVEEELETIRLNIPDCIPDSREIW